MQLLSGREREEIGGAAPLYVGVLTAIDIGMQFGLLRYRWVLDFARQGRRSGIAYPVTLNLFQGPWPAISVGAAWNEGSGHGC
ncbi:hypothetical protein CDQ92_16285 [Sphingopyxis bauzanensis]|uniref:Uncharacterized protein n=1 Tax=Sphingopyxis bauzanensis TaxID=651663 RepID=A0A246JP90_9SPHN|nr:hypothetical protein CDQ92_16285 [Sphingopyxis bauzanensis]